MTKALKTQSKFLSLILRHNPGSIGLALDDNGWALISDILEKSDVGLRRDMIIELVETSDKQRFALSEDGQRIRANQGHSIDVDLKLTAQIPQRALYHGTAEKNVAAILSKGLLRQKRHHVHLSQDEQTALKVGVRHGKPVIFAINTALMNEDGYIFYRSENDVWLTETVPPQYLTRLP